MARGQRRKRREAARTTTRATERVEGRWCVCISVGCEREELALGEWLERWDDLITDREGFGCGCCVSGFEFTCLDDEPLLDLKARGIGATEVCR